MNPAVIALMLALTSVVAIIGLAATRDTVSRSHELELTAYGGERPSRLLDLRRAANARFRRGRLGRQIDLKLAGADLHIGPADFSVVVVAAGLLIGFLLKGFLGYLGALVVIGMVLASANRWLETRRKKRVSAFVAQLPDLARLLGNAATAGLAMRSGVDIVVREMEDPARAEFLEVQRQMALGQSLETALQDLNERLPSRELNVLVRTVVIQTQAGGKLASSLAELASTLDARKELTRELKTTVSGAVFSGYTVLVIGAGSVLLMNAINPGSLDAMAKTGLGQIVLVVAGILFFIGFLLIRRITKVEI